MSASAQSMQKPQRWPLVGQPANRDGSFFKDTRLVNAIAEQDPNTGEWAVEKRFGFVLTSTLTVNGLGRGMYTWYRAAGASPAPSEYAIVGDGLTASLFLNGVVTGTPGGLGDSSGNWSFTETQSSTSNMIFASPGFGTAAKLYYTPGTGWTQATLPGARGNFIVGTAYLDGTIYFMDELCQIFGSNIDDPTTWPGTNVVTARKIPGTGISLIRQLSYIIALKTSSMEVFFDNANPTGSPLSPIDGATSPLGCANRDTVRVVDGIIFYMTLNQDAQPQIARVDNLVPTIISTPPVDRLLALSQVSGSMYSWVAKIAGHRYYAVTNDVLNLTLVYDIDQKLWYQWTDSAGNWLKIQSTGISSGFLHQFLHPSNGGLYTFKPDYSLPTDDGVITPVDIYTPNVDFGTRRGKTLHRMYIRSDQVDGSLLYVRRSSDDYQTWSNFRKIDLGRKVPYIDNEGTFVKRAYHFRHSAAKPLRIRSADLQMDIGVI